MNNVVDLNKKEHYLLSVIWNAKWYQPLWKSVWMFINSKMSPTV